MRSRVDKFSAALKLESGALGRYDRTMTKTSSPPQPPAGWQDSLVRSKSQIASGESVPLMPLLDRLRASAERLEDAQGITADGVKITANG